MFHNFVLLSFTQPEAKVVRYEYDKLNRLTKVIYEDGTSIIYKYDEIAAILGQIKTLSSIRDYKKKEKYFS